MSQCLAEGLDFQIVMPNLTINGQVTRRWFEVVDYNVVTREVTLQSGGTTIKVKLGRPLNQDFSQRTMLFLDLVNMKVVGLCTAIELATAMGINLTNEENLLNLTTPPVFVNPNTVATEGDDGSVRVSTH